MCTGVCVACHLSIVVTSYSGYLSIVVTGVMYRETCIDHASEQVVVVSIDRWSLGRGVHVYSSMAKVVYRPTCSGLYRQVVFIYRICCM